MKTLTQILLVGSLCLGCNGLPVYKSDLEMAVSTGNLRWAEKLLAAGADPNTQERSFVTPLLSEAVGKNNSEMADLLLKNGADADTKHLFRPGRITIRELATQIGDPKMIKVFQKYPSRLEGKPSEDP